MFTDGFCDPLSGLAGFGAVLVDVDMNTFQAFGGHVEEALFNELRKQVGDDQIVGQAELLAVMAARQKWCDVLGARPGRRVINFIDNDAARYGLIKGYSPSRASAWILADAWRREAAIGCFSWFDRVASTCNPADGPSRLDFSRVASLCGGKVRVVDPPVISRELLASRVQMGA